MNMEPKVIIASPGTLQNGFSRKVFEQICGNRKNGLLIPGYCVPGTLAKELLTNRPTHIKSLYGATLAVNCKIEFVSFSAHSDFKQTKAYIGVFIIIIILN